MTIIVWTLLTIAVALTCVLAVALIDYLPSPMRRWRYQAAEHRDDRLYGSRYARASGAPRAAPPIPIDTARTRHRRL